MGLSGLLAGLVLPTTSLPCCTSVLCLGILFASFPRACSTDAIIHAEHAEAAVASASLVAAQRPIPSGVGVIPPGVLSATMLKH